MNSKYQKPLLLKKGIAASVLLLACSVAGVAAAAPTVNLRAESLSTTLPDGQTVPMWGYVCSDAGVDGADCRTAKDPAVVTATSWAPPVIRVPAGSTLTINLTNHLNFSAYSAPTSLVIVGQVGGGLGVDRTMFPNPVPHSPQGTTWPGTLGTVDASSCAPGGDPGAAGTFCPPDQPARVRSMATEVAPVAANVLTGTNLTWTNLLPGTYLIESGTEPSIQGAMGLYGMLIVTEPLTAGGAAQAYGSTYDSDVPLLLSEIDPVQNREVAQVVNNTGFSDATVWNGQTGQCGDINTPATAHTCLPPAVNYSPTYYLINGVGFDRTNPNPASSSLNVPAGAGQANVLLRLVNAGLRMHVPSVVGAKMRLLAEDGNAVRGTHVQNEVFMAAGKTYDVTIQPKQSAGVYTPATYPIFDRALSLSTSNQRDGGMQAYINVNGGAASGVGSTADSGATLSASDKTFFCVAGSTLSISDPSKGLLAGAVGANGVAFGAPAGGAVTAANVTVQADGTFSYAAPAGSCAGAFTYLVNNTATHTATIKQCDATTQDAGCALATVPTAHPIIFKSNVATLYESKPPGVFAGVTNYNQQLQLTASGPGPVTIKPDGSFVASNAGANAATCTTAGAAGLNVSDLPAGTTCISFDYQVNNAQGTSSNVAKAYVAFKPGSNLVVNLIDALNKVHVTNDYRWIIEEDRTFYIDPKCQINNPTGPRLDSRGQACPPLPVESLAYNFHTSTMPVVAAGCVGDTSCELGQTQGGAPVACDVGNGACDLAKQQKTPLDPGTVYLDPNKRYFISVLPGDGVNTTIGGAGGPMQVDPNCDPNATTCAMRTFDIAQDCGPYNPTDPRWQPGNTGDADGNNAGLCGHEMGGAQIAAAPIVAGQPAARPAVNIMLQELPLPTAKLAVFVFEDDNPLNGENDSGGGVDILAPNEPGLGGFEIKLFDQAGGLGDNTGQPTYDEFNQPLSNSLAGFIDPLTGLDACPITARHDEPGHNLVGMIPTCPTFESDNKTYSPLAGQAVIANLYAGLYEVQAYPSADRIARGEEWLQTNTLDGGAPHEAFLKPNEPGYFQEFGPGGFHVSIGFANPKTINSRKDDYCNSPANNLGACNHTLTVHVTNNHMSRTPDQRTWDSGTYDNYSFTTCYVSVGPADREDFALEKCAADGTATFNNMPNGVFKISVFDQWNDILLDGLVGTVTVTGDTDKTFPVTQWRANLSTHTYIDTNRDGLPEEGEPGLALASTNIRYRDGSFGFFNNTDLNGDAGFNEVFPFMNWLVVETTSTRFKPEAVHTVYDVGGAVDTSGIAANLANTTELSGASLPAALRLPGAVYCADPDCSARVNVPLTASAAVGPLSGLSSGVIARTEPWGATQGWQGLLGQNSFMEFAMRPFADGENGGIQGHVIYASTRPFDDPSLLLQLSWAPGVAHVKLNLYSKTTDENGNERLTLVDTTTTTSWDDWAQGFHLAADGVTKIPNMNCPGQDPTSPFFQTLKDSKQWLDPSNPKTALPNDSQFKCYDGWSVLNQVQPAPYDGMYSFPSVTKTDPVTGRATDSNCTACVNNPDSSDALRFNTPMLPAGTYVVEVVVPPGYELVKEEDKNILLGDVYIAPVTTQFAGFGNIYIMPDQAAVNTYYNPSNPGSLDLTTNLGAAPRHEGDTGSIETFWPCVGAERTVPDLNSLFPGAGQAAPFAGAKRRLCDRKEVVLTEQASVLAKFYIFSSTHVAGHYTGTITNDFASEFDPFSPQFGEKFSPPNLPVAMRDFNGNEVARVYGDQWGSYNGLYFSTWSVNPPNPTGYAPQMSIACMNDPGPIADPTTGAMITDPAYNPAYSNFCYEWPFMPGQTAYMDTPVIPTQAFADTYNLPDSEYPDATPAIASVVNTDPSAPQGPWVSTGLGGTAPTVQFSITGVAVTDQITAVTVNATNLIGGTLRCGSGLLILTCNNLVSQTTRNNTMAVAVSTSINLRTGITGYSATVSGNTVTVTAPLSPPVANGTLLTVAQTGVIVTPIPGPTLAFAGAVAGPPVALGLTINALGDKVVQNPNFSGPNSTTAPYNQKTITRHYGFGSTPSGCTLVSCPNVTVGGVPLTNVVWTDMKITGTVTAAGVPNCTVQQRNQLPAKCGELVITAGNGKQSIDAITVTIDGSMPWIVTVPTVAGQTGVTAPTGKSVKNYALNFGRMGASPIQTAIDSASPGDLIIVQPGTYRENLLMWKPVRLQGVGAASVTVNADAHPAGKMDQWRRQVNCLFGLTLDGAPNPHNANYKSTDPSNRAYSCPAQMFMRSDRIPFEALIGWDAAGNGNLAQVLQEPTLMGAYEGAGITVLGRGVRAPACNNPTFGANCQDLWGVNATGGPGAFTDGSVYLGAGTADCTPSPNQTDNTGFDYGTANYFCNPSRIDGLSVLNSSQGGGGVFIHGWAHNLDVGNTRISGNHGTLAGGINLGNGETPDAFVNDGTECGTALTGANAVMPCPPIPYRSSNGTNYGSLTNSTIPFQWNTKVRIHHNMIYNNASIGDALFSGTPAGAGAITISAGGDDYQIDHNWIAGNMSTGDGGGVQHLGLSFNGNLNHNYILFNQSSNPTLPTHGGGLIIEGASLDRQLNGQECGSFSDLDCPPGIGEGVGFSTVIDSNLILGNSAESGSGGGVRLQQVNGTEVTAFPAGPDPVGGTNASPGWYDVTMTNNIIANNVAGWDGGGVSLQDALKVTFINNTVASNDTTASAGTLFKTLGAINGSSAPPGCDAQTDPTLPQDPSCTGNSAQHGPQPSGLVVMQNTPNLISAINDLGGGTSGAVRCPANFGYTSNLISPNSNRNDCRKLSKPRMANDLFWQNRYFSVNIIGVGTGNQSNQNLVVLTPQLTQNATGACSANNNYWDIGLRTDDVASGSISRLNNSLTLINSIYSANNSVGDATGSSLNPATSLNNIIGGPTPVVAQYCNGARVPPENCAAQGGLVTQASCHGYNTPVGASETTGQNPLFQFNGIQPAATVDEGNNWLNLVYGPLTLSRPNANISSNAEMMLASRVPGTAQGAYSIPGSSSAINHGTNSSLPGTTASDFFGNARARSVANPADIGAVEFGSTGAATGAVVAPANLSFGNSPVGQATAAQTLTLTAGSTAMTGISVTGLAAPFTQSGGTCIATLAANTSCTINVVFTPSATGAATGSVTISATTGGPVTGSPVPLSGNGGGAVNLTVTPVTTLQFGDVYVGLSSAAQAVTLTNTGATPVTGITLAGLGGVFNDAGGGTCTPALLASLPASGSCTVNVRFTPAVMNPVNGSLTVSAAGGAVISGSPLQLAGNGLLPTITPTSLDFGTVPTGTQVRMTLVVDNSKNINSNPAFPISSLTITAPYTRPGGTAGGTCPAVGGSVPANGTCTIVVQFLQAVGSAGTGTTAGTLTMTSTGGPPSLPVVNLTANSVTGTYHVSGSPSPLAFGNQAVGATSATRNLTVANTGNSPIGGMTVTGITAPFTRVTTGTFPAGAGNCGATLAVGASCTIKVRFAPTANGLVTRTLTLGGAGLTAPNPAVPVTLSGTGVAPLVSFTGATNATLGGGTLAFGNPAGNVSSLVTVTVGSGGAVTFGTATVSGSTRFTKGTDTCSGNTVVANGTCTIRVNFNGTGTTPRTGTLTVVDSTGSQPVPPLNLTGS